MTLSDDPEKFFQDPQELMADANTQAIIDAVTTGITQLQNAITTAITNATAAPPAGPFLRTPLQANVDNTIDFASKEGRRYHEMATKSLFPDGEKFDAEPSMLGFPKICEWRRLGSTRVSQSRAIGQSWTKPETPGLTRPWRNNGHGRMTQTRSHAQHHGRSTNDSPVQVSPIEKIK